jgi:viroplasmin and RNaseH domain-containing protein
MTWYALFKDKVPGVYAEWKDGQKQVNKFRGNNYKGYPTKEQTKASYLEHLADERRNWNMKTIMIPFMLIVVAFLVYVIVA